MEGSCVKRLGLVVLIAFCLLFILVGGKFYSILNAPLLSKGQSAVIIPLSKSVSASQLATMLFEQKLIASPKPLVLWIRFKGIAHQLKAGVYEILPGESAVQLLAKIVAGEVIIRNFVIIPGTTCQKIIQDLARMPYLDYQPEHWAVIPLSHPNYEGLLLADTYQYGGGGNAKTILQQAYTHLNEYLNQAWQDRSANLPYANAYELLIAASIIEKETALPNEKRLISGVLVNRLRKKMPLQMDPTVIYGLGKHYMGRLSHQNMQFNSPYNSYQHRGLPPTPIAMVGKDSIDAAAHPQESGYLYFVAKGDGSHHFSKTYTEQKEAIEYYRHKD